MKIAFDGLIMNLQPDAVNWEPPRFRRGTATLRPCADISSRAVSLWADWLCHPCKIGRRCLQLSVACRQLPHPYTGVMTDFDCYVDSVTPRMDVSDQKDNCAVVAGLDVALAGILVT